MGEGGIRFVRWSIRKVRNVSITRIRGKIGFREGRAKRGGDALCLRDERTMRRGKGKCRGEGKIRGALSIYSF